MHFCSSLAQELYSIRAQIADRSAQLPASLSVGERYLIQALVVAEDRRYCSHPGVDIFSIARALYRALFMAKIEGASTIEQQLVRTMRQRYEFSVSRKVSECLLAMGVVRAFDKVCLARVYLNIAYFGWRANGVHQAAHRLGLNVDDLNREQAALLAAMLKVPMPREPSARYLARRAQRVAYIVENWREVEARYGFPV